MKLNLAKVATSWGTTIDGHYVKYGFYDSGRAFVAVDNEVLTFAEAYSKFKPKNQFAQYDCFYDGLHEYPKNMKGLVAYLVNKYNK